MRDGIFSGVGSTIPRLKLNVDAEGTMFNPAKQSRVAEDIVDQVEQAIIKKRLKPGDRLQTERELQETFQTSRGTVREALGVLKQKGLIDIRRGGKGGAFVREVGVDQISESLAFLIKHRRVSFKELSEFRISAEGTAAGLAAERATPEDVQELRRLLDQGRAYLQGKTVSLDEFYRWEREMHQTLARLSGNSIIEWVMRTIHINLDAYVDLVYWTEEEPEQTFAEWVDIVDGIEAGEAFRVSSLIKSHLVKFNRILKEGAKRQGLLASDKDDLVLQ